MYDSVVRLFSKIQFYKRVIRLSMIFSIFSVALGVSLSLSWVFDKSSVAEELAQKQKVAGDIESIYHHLLVGTGEKVSDSYPLWKLLDGLGLEKKANKSQMVSELKALSSSNHEQITNLQTRLSKYHWVLMVTGFVTLLFGWILPGLVIRILTKLTLKLKTQLEDQTKQWVVNFADAKSQYPNKPFANPEFWVQLVLMHLQMAPTVYSHPMTLYLSQLAEMIRSEIKKSEVNSDSPKDHVA